MKKNILIVGVGGQGTLLASVLLGNLALEKGYDVKLSEVHGMSQRGGDVQSHLRLSARPISSDLIPHGKADLIISVEPMESLRYLPFLSPDGVIVTATEPYINITAYPDMQKLLDTIAAAANHVFVNADVLAKEAGSAKSYNVVMLGAAAPYLEIETEELEKAIEMFFSRKGQEMVDMNIKAFRLGLANSLSEQE